MFYLKLIKYFYIFLILLIILTPVNYKFIDFLPSIIFLLSIYLAFKYSFPNKMTKSRIILSNTDYSVDNNKKTLFIFTLFAVFFVPIYIQFYTGSSMLTSIQRFFSGTALGSESTYYQYQQYFQESGLGEFTLQKIPFILGYGVLKFAIWIFSIKIIGYTRKIHFTELSCIIILYFSLLFIGISRGTSFELFEVLFLLIYCLLFRFRYLYSSSWFTGKTKIIIYSLIALSIYAFIFSKSLRYSGDTSTFSTSITNTLVYDPDHFIAQHFPVLTNILMNLGGYFLFGMYAIANALNRVLLNGTLSGFFAANFPYGLQIANYGDSYKDLLCNEFIDCGVAWIPDSLNILQSTGLIIFFLMLFILGKVARIAYFRAINNDLWFSIILYVITYFMFSLPVGNFLTASSATILSILFLLITYYKPLRLRLYKLKFKRI